MRFVDTQVKVKETLSSCHRGTASEVRDAMASRLVDVPSIRTVERHLDDLKRLGVVSCDAELRGDRAVKVWKVIPCLEMPPNDDGKA